MEQYEQDVWPESIKAEKVKGESSFSSNGFGRDASSGTRHGSDFRQVTGVR